jgi:hypothetical protein
MARPDMSPLAITARLKRVAQLRQLGLSLKKAKIKLPDAKSEESRASSDRKSK